MDTLWLDEHMSAEYTTITFGDVDSRLCESFDGTVVKINGRLNFTEGNTALYPLNGNDIYRPIWLSLDSISPQLKAVLTHKHGAIVSISGVIDLKNSEHYFPYYCAIKNISCVCGNDEE
ncbi:MAG: hypothetical protein QM802_10055 [Agriterribacter sp.]